jgi:F0F1-type ATP synthase delta subunit
MISSTIEKHAEALFELAQDENAVADYEAALQNVLLSLSEGTFFGGLPRFLCRAETREFSPD